MKKKIDNTEGVLNGYGRKKISDRTNRKKSYIQSRQKRGGVKWHARKAISDRICR